jgi:hypothetical protein
LYKPSGSSEYEEITSNPISLLPGDYTFKAEYILSASAQEKEVTVAPFTPQTVTFELQAVDFKLRGCDYIPEVDLTNDADFFITDPTDINLLRYPINATGDVFPGTYQFTVGYLGVRESLNAEIVDQNDPNSVSFQTGCAALAVEDPNTDTVAATFGYKTTSSTSSYNDAELFSIDGKQVLFLLQSFYDIQAVIDITQTSKVIINNPIVAGVETPITFTASLLEGFLNSCDGQDITAQATFAYKLTGNNFITINGVSKFPLFEVSANDYFLRVEFNEAYSTSSELEISATPTLQQFTFQTGCAAAVFEYPDTTTCTPADPECSQYDLGVQYVLSSGGFSPVELANDKIELLPTSQAFNPWNPQVTQGNRNVISFPSFVLTSGETVSLTVPVGRTEVFLGYFNEDGNAIPDNLGNPTFGALTLLYGDSKAQINSVSPGPSSIDGSDTVPAFVCLPPAGTETDVYYSYSIVPNGATTPRALLDANGDVYAGPATCETNGANPIPQLYLALYQYGIDVGSDIDEADYTFEYKAETESAFETFTPTASTATNTWNIWLPPSTLRWVFRVTGPNSGTAISTCYSIFDSNGQARAFSGNFFRSQDSVYFVNVVSCP